MWADWSRMGALLRKRREKLQGELQRVNGSVPVQQHKPVLRLSTLPAGELTMASLNCRTGGPTHEPNVNCAFSKGKGRTSGQLVFQIQSFVGPSPTFFHFYLGETLFLTSIYQRRKKRKGSEAQNRLGPGLTPYTAVTDKKKMLVAYISHPCLVSIHVQLWFCSAILPLGAKLSPPPRPPAHTHTLPIS